MSYHYRITNADDNSRHIYTEYAPMTATWERLAEYSENRGGHYQLHRRIVTTAEEAKADTLGIEWHIIGKNACTDWELLAEVDGNPTTINLATWTQPKVKGETP